MSISIESSRVRYVGDGGTSTYAYTFPVTDATHIVIDIADDNGENEITLAYPGDYTVDLTAQTVTLVHASYAPLPSNYQMSIRRVVPLKQLFEVDHDGPYNPADYEGTWDRTVEMCQQLYEMVVRCAKTQPWSDETGDDLIDWIEAAVAAAQAAQAAAEAAQAAAEAAQASAEQWATLLDALVDATDYSSKEWAIGTTVPSGSSKDWAVTAEDTIVSGTEYSSYHWAVKSAASAAAAAVAQLAAEAAQAAAEAARDAAIAATGLPVTQAGHGFDIFDPVRYNKATGLWVLAQGDSVANLATHIVSSVTSLDIFVPADGGFIVDAGHGLTVGDKYWLSQTVAGDYTNVEPVLGEVARRQQVFIPIDADTVSVELHTTSIYDQKKEVKEVTQAGHGLVAGKPVRFNDATGLWVLAQSDVEANKATHIVLEGTTTEVLFLGETGIHTWTGHGLNVGSTYYVSPTVAGDLVEGEPATGEPNPVVFVMDANTVLLKLLAVGGGGASDITKVEWPNDGSVTEGDTAYDVLNHQGSSLIFDGFDLTDNLDGTADMALGEILLRTGSDHDSPLESFQIAAQAGLTFTDNSVNIIYVDYNAGTPIVGVTTDLTTCNVRDCFGFYSITRVGTELHIVDYREVSDDAIAGYTKRFTVGGLYEHGTGAMLSESGTRNLALTAGRFYIAALGVSTAAFDTSVADTLTYVYQDGVGGWTRVPAQTQIDNLQYDDGTGVLATLANNKYGVHWVYIVKNVPDKLFVMYGRAEYLTLAAAQAASVPSNLPPEFNKYGSGILVGKVIIQKSAVSFADIQSPFVEVLGSANPVNHNDLSGLDAGEVGYYGHMTSAEQAVIGATVINLEETRMYENDTDGVAPLVENEFGLDHFVMPDGGDREIWGMLDVPRTHITGRQIQLGVKAYSESATNTWLLTATGYLVRVDTDAIDDVTNSRASTNTAVTNTVAKMLRRILCDITDSNGQINGVNVEAGDSIRYKIVRGVGTDTANVKVIKK